MTDRAVYYRIAANDYVRNLEISICFKLIFVNKYVTLKRKKTEVKYACY